MNDLSECQYIWYFQDIALAYRQKSDFEAAIESFEKIVKFYEDFVNDEFDFHGYVMRKNTFGDYIDTVLHHDELASNQIFIDALINLVDCSAFLHSKKNVDQKLGDMRLDESPLFVKCMNYAKRLEKYCNNEASLEALYLFYKAFGVSKKFEKCLLQISKSFPKSFLLQALSNSPSLNLYVNILQCRLNSDKVIDLGTSYTGIPREHTSRLKYLTLLLNIYNSDQNLKDEFVRLIFKL